ncbi:hypothetical protein K8R62_00435 [bacterium]|nr:hypothetical protein [bacterium]
MKLSNKAIKDFKKIYLKEYGIILSDEKIKDEAVKFFKMMQVIFKGYKK